MAKKILGYIKLQIPAGKANPLDTEHVVSLIKQFSQSMPKVEDKDIFTLSNMLEKTISIYNSTF